MPTVAALALIAAFNGISGLRRELRERLRFPHEAGGWLCVAVVAPVIVTEAGVIAARMVGEGQAFIPVDAIWITVLLQIATGAVGEEFGWRGFMLSRLGPLFTPRWAALAMALLWCSWHVPAFFVPELPHYTMPMIPALLTTLAFGVFLAFLFDRAHGSILATIPAHLSLNIALAIGGVQLTSQVFWWVTGSVYAICAAWMLMQMTGPQRCANVRPLSQDSESASDLK